MSGIFKKFKSGDKKITSHFAHKLYTVNVSNSVGTYVEAGYEQKRIVDNVEVDVDLSVFAYDSLYDGSKFEPDLYDIDGSVSVISPHARTTNGLFKRSIHDSLQAMYYTDTMNPANTQHNIGFEKEFRILHKSAQVLSIPQVMMGSGIVKESVIITSGSTILKDDGFGNLIDTTLVTQTALTEATKSLDLDFNSLYNQVNVKIQSAYSMNSLADGNDELPLDNKVRFYDNSAYANKVVARNFTPIDTAFGTALEFDGVASANAEVRGEITSQSLVRVKAGPQFDFKNEGYDDDKWQIILKVSASVDQPSKDIPFASAYTEVLSKGSKSFPIRLQYINTNDNTNKGKYRIKVKDDRGNVYTATSAAVFKDADGFTSLSIARVGTNILFHYRTATANVGNVTLQMGATSTQKQVGNTNNKNPWILGAKLKWRGKYKKKKKKGDYSKRPKPRKEYYRNFKGAIGEFSIYRGANVINGAPLIFILCDTEIGGETNKVGNVFYNHGIITLTSTNSFRYTKGIRSNFLADCDLIFENSHQIVEQEYTCQVKEQEFGFTLNPTIVKPESGGLLKDFVSGSAWSPYVTTIGLYDKNARLLAIGKLAQPIQKSNKYDTTFVVRFDS